MPNEQQTQGNILIVDDTPNNLRLLAKMLTDRGYKVRPAPSGARALATTEKEVPDLVLLDVMMPEMNGYEVCRALKAIEKTRDIPIIFLSALNELEDKMKGFEVGGVDYITKPFQEKEVMLRVETHLKIRNLQQELLAETVRFKTLAEAAFEGIVIHADDGIIDVNPEAARLLGCQEAGLIGTDLMQRIPSEIQQQVLSDQKVPFEGHIIGKDNTLVPVEIRTKNLPLNDHQVSVTAIRDLTLQKQTEQEKEQLLQENTVLKMTMQDRYKFGDIIGRSPAMQMVYELISKAATSRYPVVVYGESGTGKELVAKTIHALDVAGDKPYVIVNCGAVTESLFEREFFGHRKGAFTGAVRDEPGYLDAAHKGTLFLDEIGELPLTMQVKLLRVLESGEYTPVGAVASKQADIRVIAATNKDLTNMVRLGKFREDLFYRIQVIEITLPPLRERREDIRLLVEHILAQQGAQDKMAALPEKLRGMLFHYDWPGNVRELVNTIQRYLATDFVTLPGQPQGEAEEKPSLDSGLHDTLDALEKKMIGEALQQTKWRRSETAALLQIPRRSLLRKMQKYDLKSSDFE
ncbi:MAG: sigma-54-dependent Fis family transcriptional regulator [Desulfuromonadales bacterium]|nr:sigma-54-dependent Fis family transcriptional regulator [Desulfuromonadales bacterium]